MNSVKAQPLIERAELLRRSRILIIEDEPAAAEMLRATLLHEGCEEVEIVLDSRKVLDRFLEFKPDLVLLDWKMPEISGATALRQLREQTAPDSYLPILVVTAFGQPDVKRAALGNGATDFILKPYDRDEIMLRVANLLQTRWLYLRARDQNRLLQQQVEEQTAELSASNAALRLAQEELEERIRHRTTALVVANRALAAESETSKEAEKAAHLRALILDSVAEAVIASDATGAIMYVNSTAEQLYGWPAGEMAGCRAMDLIVPESQRPHVEEVVAKVAAGAAWSGELRLRRRDGTVFPAFTVMSPIFDENGQYAGRIGVTRDITAEKQTQLALRESESRLRTVIETSPAAIFLKDLEGRYTMVNRAFAELRGISSDEMLGKTASDFLPPEMADQISKNDREVLKTGRSRIFDEQLVGTNPHTFIVAKAPLYDEQARMCGLCGVATDISARKQAEEILRQTERRLAFVLSTTPAVIHTIRLVSGLPITFVSDNVLEQLGYDPAHIMRDRNFLSRHIHPEDRRHIRQQIRLLLRLGHHGREFRIRHRDGRYLWIYSESVVVRDAAGEPQEIIGYAVNISRRKRIEAALRESEERLRALIQSIDEIVFELDANGTYLNVWTEDERLLARPRSELLGRKIEDVLGKETATPFLSVIRSVIENGRSERIVYELDVTGGHHWFLARISPILSHDGSCRSVCMLAREITEQKQIEQELRRTKVEAEQANAAKSEFLSRMSHELRTPLNSIIGFAQLVEDDAHTEEERENVEQILYAGRHLLQLINEILDISRIEAGRVDMEIEVVALQVAASAALALVQPLATERGIELPAFVCNYYVLADGQRLQQVLLNLLSNAIKYNNPGGRVELHCREVGNGMLRFEVADTGVGIEDYDLPKLFQPFQRVGSTSDQVEGVGLGLVICDRLIRSMGGTTGAHSEPGIGSTFWFELPLAQAMPDSEARAETAVPLDSSPQRGNAKTILYIEDNLPNLRLMERILIQRPSVRMIAAQQGSLGLALARHHLPDVVLLDLQLPDMQGDEVLTWLRADRRTRHIPVVVVSANAIPGQIERLKKLGATAYVTKPFDVRCFLEVLDRALTEVSPPVI